MHLRKELLEARHRLAELEPAWEMFIDKNNDEEEARDQEQRRRAAVTAQPSERRIRGPKDAPADSAAEISHLATPRGADNVLSGSASTLGMFSSVSTGLESASSMLTPTPRRSLMEICWKTSSWCPLNSSSHVTMKRWSTSCPRFIDNSCWFMRIAAMKKARRRFALWTAPLSGRLRVSASTS